MGTKVTIRVRGFVWLNAAMTTTPEEAIPGEGIPEVLQAATREAHGVAARFPERVADPAEALVTVGRTSKIIPGCSRFSGRRTL